MDTSTVLSIVLSVVSIIISAILTIIGIILSIKSATTLSSIKNEVSVQTEQYMHLLEKYHTSYDDLTGKLMEMQLKTLELHNLPNPISSSPKVDTKTSGSIPGKAKFSEISKEEKK